MPASPTRSADAGRTVDAFHRGGFRIVQPAKTGHRAGMDAMMLAACVPAKFKGKLADFGAGAGAAGMAAASRCEGAHVTLVERSADMAGFARQSVEHPDNMHLKPRLSVLECDVTLAGRARVAAGLSDDAFDFVIMNPPFNAAGDRATPHPLKRSAHVMKADLFEAWLRTAAAVVRPQGRVAIIARPVSIAAILVAIERRFGGCEILPIHPRADAAAIRIVLRAVRGSRAPLALRPPLVLHEAGERFSARADAINDGLTSLFGD